LMVDLFENHQTFDNDLNRIINILNEKSQLAQSLIPFESLFHICLLFDDCLSDIRDKMIKLQHQYLINEFKKGVPKNSHQQSLIEPYLMRLHSQISDRPVHKKKLEEVRKNLHTVLQDDRFTIADCEKLLEIYQLPDLLDKKLDARKKDEKRSDEIV
jgi:hypothetical protein